MIHKTSIIDSKAKISKSAKIGPYTIIGPNVIIEEEVEDKLVYLMSVNKARFRNPIMPNCKLFLEIKAIRSRGRVWRYQGIAKVNEKKMADAEWAATIMDRIK